METAAGAQAGSAHAGSLQRALASLGEFMAKYPNAKTHTPTDPNNLPWGSPKPVTRAPYTSPAQFKTSRLFGEPVRVAQAGSLSGIGLPNTTLPLTPTPEDLAPHRGRADHAGHKRPRRFPFTAAMTHFARAVGAARSGDAAAAERDVQELARIVDALKAAKDAYWTAEVEVQRLGGAAWVAFAKGEREEALKEMRAAADLEDKSEKAAVSPGRIVPARELLGDMLAESGRPGEALAEYERSQAHDPNRYRSLNGAGQAAAQSGNREKARYYFTRLNELAGSGDPRPEMEKARRYLASN